LLIDIPKKVQEIKDLLTILDRPVDQVMIEARIVIADETFARDLGAKFGVGGYDTGNSHRFLGSGSISNNTALQNAIVGGTPIPRDLNVNLGVVGAPSVGFTILGASTYIDVELSALEKNGRGEIISNPRVITSNQREAVIRQGQEVGYVTTTPGAVGATPTQTVAFKDVLLELKVTPTITSDGRVYLTVALKKDDIAGFTETVSGRVPSLNKREINTAVLIENGQTVVIGGVYEFTSRDDVSKVPFLGDVPFLRNFFRQKSKSKNKAELLVFLTPRVLQTAHTQTQDMNPREFRN